MIPPSDDDRILNALLTSQRLAVLATSGGDVPHASLMAFARDPETGRLIFATAQDSRKYRNLRENPLVALLIDNRRNRSADFREAAAVTIRGRAKELEGSERAEALDVYLERHPDLAAFAPSEGTALFAVTVTETEVIGRFQE